MLTRPTAVFLIAGVAWCAGLGALAQTSKEKKAEKETLTFEVYKDAKGEFRWRLKAANNKSIGDSGEGYKNKADCIHGIELIQKNAEDAKTDDKT